MLRISKLADYACLIMSMFIDSDLNNLNYLNNLNLPNATNIAQSLKLGLPTVRKILQLLSRAGVLTASRGTLGGYQLARPLQQISLLEIVEAIDGKLGLTDCCASRDCQILNQCQNKQGWKQINEVVAQALREKKLSEFIGGSA
jgi:FeS assembly SUF system regulator